MSARRRERCGEEREEEEEKKKKKDRGKRKCGRRPTTTTPATKGSAPLVDDDALDQSFFYFIFAFSIPPTNGSRVPFEPFFSPIQHLRGSRRTLSSFSCTKKIQRRPKSIPISTAKELAGQERASERRRRRRRKEKKKRENDVERWPSRSASSICFPFSPRFYVPSLQNPNQRRQL